MFLVPQFVVKFEPEKGSIWNWIVNGEEELDTFCKILRWNGIKAYSVTPKDLAGLQEQVLQKQKAEA